MNACLLYTSAKHDAIMTMSETVDEGIQNMNDQVPSVMV